MEYAIEKHRESNREINETIIKIIMKQLYQTSRKVLHHSKLKKFLDC